MDALYHPAVQRASNSAAGGGFDRATTTVKHNFLPLSISHPKFVGAFVNFGETAWNLQDHNAGWSELWDTNQRDLWARGKPSPTLVDFIEKARREHLTLPRRPDEQRLKALAQGCGRGYDVVMLALHGLDAFGLEVYQTAVT
ncbi:uncharacterized protein Z519_02014 [Cladophialophora bantiana CBS 173.52]|uniref:Uncharacterized protein n=1 Tax=Cladophialophora bantiana (strain ATCC 10958 / CBS 173.52 / CDC B-1940 / NIH 8579) TaxID=1442370 RepID=A0A0D2HT19_CLAB1|nr:uncharacterized protein Z519_02014 [Cladophialophora bantiana CBS 173.52]KIW96623.1 hypothetical protein Z519_02014 [Cladophialophora bantiana CBS 173.52]